MAENEKRTTDQFFSDLVFQEPDLRSERDARTIGFLEKALVFIMALLLLWTAVYLWNQAWAGALINIVSMALMLLTVTLLRKKRVALALHLVFWVGFFTIWLIILCFDGPGRPVTRMTQFWFIFLAAAAYMTFGPMRGRWRDYYAVICGGSFFIVHFDFLQLGVAFALDQSIRYIANIVMLFVVAALISFLCWLFVSDILAGEARLDRANARLEELLENMLPHTVAQRLRSEGKTFAQGFSEVSILFADIVGFADFADHNPPGVVVNVLDKIFSRFDDLSETYGLEKIKTVGGVYMVVAGVPEPRHDHAEAVARFALDMLRVAKDFPELGIKIGINSGPVVAGVIGTSRLIYDLWGDSVNLAQRMEAHGLPGSIQVSESTYHLLHGKFALEPRGKIYIKGKGELEAYLLLGEAFNVKLPGLAGATA